MSHKIIILFSLLFVLLISCESNKTSDETQFAESVEDIEVFQTVYAEGICEIQVPDYFVEMDDVNEFALIQTGYIAEPDAEDIIIDDEIYAIVLVDYKNEIEKVYGDSIQMSLLDFNGLTIQNLDYILEDLTVGIENPIIQEQNGLKNIHNEFYGRLGEYLIYYQTSIYETEIGFYRVLTWCMQDHLTKHKSEMYKITSSFKEL